MAYIPILGGSPLGLIGVKSRPDSSGMSTFNGGQSRNVKVKEYNENKSNAGMVSGNSLFSGYRLVRAWPNIKDEDPKGLGDVDYAKKLDNSTRRALHNNSIYDTSVLNIIEKLSGTKAQLKPTDFAYLKNIGVYPNNRLVVVRRFATPADDNIMVKIKDGLGPLATVISWIPENDNFLEISFGEEWMDAEADFKGLLTQLGEDIGLGNLGGISGAAGNALPLPGFTEIFQRHFLANLGLLESSEKNSIPAGNPNLIKMAKRRKTVGYSDPGSGLKCQVNIKVVCEYELKYISGIDPTIVWMDLIGMITRFGTSNSSTYGLSKDAAAKMITWANNPNELIKGVASALTKAIGGIVKEVKEAIEKAYNSAMELASKLSDSTEPVETPPVSEKAAAEAAASKGKEEQNAALALLETALNGMKLALEGLLKKYRVRIIGIVNALSGLPSTPWHITIGNPMRPTFCSGDMLVDNVTMTLGPTLMFNDLPSSIKIEFNITNARPWGLQEIMAKFNSGYLRTVDIQKTFYETGTVTNDSKQYEEPVGD